MNAVNNKDVLAKAQQGRYKDLFDTTLPFEEKLEDLKVYAKDETIPVIERVTNVLNIAVVGDSIALTLPPSGKMAIANRLSTDVIGSIIEGHIGRVLNELIPHITCQEQRQLFPDVYYKQATPEEIEIEIKSYNGKGIPSFDVSNFDAFIDTIIEKPNRLNATYLLATYKISADLNSFVIESITSKSVWEICGPVSARSEHPVGTINAQVKRKMAYNIRPVSRNRTCFSSKKELIESLLISVEYFCKDTSTDRHKERVAGLKALL